jgi:pimeloyl-ACP methyl ester carboxylesterase
VIEFIEATGRPVILMGNSMGGLVCEMVASDRPDLVARLVLVSPATPPRFPYDRLHWPTALRLAIQATPGAGRALAYLVKNRYTPEELVDLSLRLITHEPNRVPPQVVESLVDLAKVRIEFPWAVTALTKSANSTAMAYRRPREFVKMIRRIQARTLIIHGVADRIVSPSAVEWLHSLRSDWDLIQMDDTGHTPQLDAPVRFFKEVDRWLSRNR